MKLSLVLAAIGVACLPMLAAVPAHAQATRTWVSGVGDDVNPCSRTAPCKTFAGAISKTAVLSRVPGVSEDEELEPSSDPTGTFFTGNRADAERGHLGWLRSGLLAVQNARRQGGTGLHLGTPPGVR